jgi:hypothetical protein
MARNLRGGYPSASRAISQVGLNEVGAFFNSDSSDLRGAVRKIALEQALNRGWKTLNGKVSTRKYLASLGTVASIVAPFGHGEMTYRDFEAAWFGALLFKPSVEHLFTFPNVLTPWVTYVPLSWDPRRWGAEVEGGIAHQNAKDIRDELHVWSTSLGSESSRETFIRHFHHCILLSGHCGLCELPQAGVNQSTPPQHYLANNANNLQSDSQFGSKPMRPLQF